MREALVRIAGNLSSAKEKEWQGAIDTFLALLQLRLKEMLMN